MLWTLDEINNMACQHLRNFSGIPKPNTNSIQLHYSIESIQCFIRVLIHFTPRSTSECSPPRSTAAPQDPGLHFHLRFSSGLAECGLGRFVEAAEERRGAGASCRTLFIVVSECLFSGIKQSGTEQM